MSQNFDPNGPESRFMQADGMIERGDIVGATELLAKLIEDFPEYGRAYNHLGYLYETKYRNPAQAEAYYKKCLEYSPEYPAIYYNYGVLLSTQERFGELEELVERALKVPGINKSKIYNEHAIMREVQGRYDESRQSYLNAVRYSFAENEIATYKKSLERIAEKKRIFEGEPDSGEPGGDGGLPPHWN